MKTVVPKPQAWTYLRTEVWVFDYIASVLKREDELTSITVQDGFVPKDRNIDDVVNIHIFKWAGCGAGDLFLKCRHFSTKGREYPSRKTKPWVDTTQCASQRFPFCLSRFLYLQSLAVFVIEAVVKVLLHVTDLFPPSIPRSKPIWWVTSARPMTAMLPGPLRGVSLHASGNSQLAELLIIRQPWYLWSTLS